MTTKEQIQEFCFVENNWFRAKYHNELSAHSSRYWTFKTALNLFLQRGAGAIVETGCVREPEDYGAGFSTVLFADFAQRYGFDLVSIDNSEEHIRRCKAILAERKLDTAASFILSDSFEALQTLKSLTIGLLYLDSFDSPYVEILQKEFPNLSYKEAEVAMHASDWAALEEKYQNLVRPCQQHCLAELIAARDKMINGGLILIDDNLPGASKGTLAKRYLLETGAMCLLDDRQSLWQLN